LRLTKASAPTVREAAHGVDLLKVSLTELRKYLIRKGLTAILEKPMISRGTTAGQGRIPETARPLARCGRRHPVKWKICLLWNAMLSGLRVDTADLERSELEQYLESAGIQKFHARQIFQWIYRRGVTNFEAMTDLGRDLRAQLTRDLSISTPTVVKRDQSSDGTTKFLLRLADDQLIESVFIPDTPSQTFCISTQVGCAMRCAFCLTGRMGIVRNLTASEIAGQVRVLLSELNMLGQRFNIVLMGMGEPLHNYDATMKALRILADEHGLSVPSRRITLSTVGVLPALERLATEPFMPNLAISLHSTTEDQRDLLVPINRKYGLRELLDACRRFPLKRRNRITFEYVLLKDVNDTPEDARRLVKLLSGIKAKVNLLPLNEAAGIPFERPSDARVNRFAHILAEHRVTVSVRRSRGRDIRAACGQLITESARSVAPGQRLARLME
jgi:23S rRNA (adenine2503-C2)-methyltransferase